MPTTRPRHQITETPEIADAIDRAALRWPGESRARLLVRLVELGAAAEDERRRQYLAAVDRWAGMLTDVYPDGYLEDLRKDWPE